MNILITGGSGFLGAALTHALQTQSVNGEKAKVTWVSRVPANSQTLANAVIGYDELAATQETFDVIINLAGAGIADKRWSADRKQQLLASRIRPTQAVIDYLRRIAIKPKLFISGSALGWYGVQNEDDLTALDETNTEHAKNHPDFSHELCQRWESLACSAQALAPVILLRTGVVIAPDGGMMTRLLRPFKLGLGGQLGTGRQMMSWISREDWVRAVLFIIDKHFGRSSENAHIYNLTAPTPITNSAFAQSVGHWLHRPTLLPLPRFLLKALLGEMATLLIDGPRVVPNNLLASGFVFRHLTLTDALEKP